MIGKDKGREEMKRTWLKHQQLCDQLWSKLLTELDLGEGAMPNLIDLRRRFDEVGTPDDLAGLLDGEFELMLALTKMALYELHVQETGILAFQDDNQHESEGEDYE